VKVWLIFVQGDDTTWLEASMDDESTAESGGQWDAEVKRVQKLCADNDYEYRIIAANVPGVYEEFEIPVVDAVREAT
jgi:hypothetical protein